MGKLVLAVVLVSLCWGSGAGAVPIQWTVASGGNGHWYEFFPDQMARDAAQTFSGSHFHLGVQGHLVTITSASERDFLIANNMPDVVLDSGAWIGAYQDTSAPDYSEPAGGWRWSTGEAWSFENWNLPIEPNDHFHCRLRAPIRFPSSLYLT